MVSELLDAGPGRLPVCARLAWWGTAWLRGLVVTDQVLDEVPGTGLLDALLECRRRGARGLALAWPLPGHPIGLAGPPDLNTVVLGHGQAVVAVQAEVCVVPVAGEDGVHWEALRAHPAPVLDLAEADRDLRHGIVAAATELAELDVARWRPEFADELHELGAPMPVSAPPGVRREQPRWRHEHCWPIGSVPSRPSTTVPPCRPSSSGCAVSRCNVSR